MILKKIALNNIRSYKNQEINFPEGSTLLSGDIGSGKTSILLGIEFALFGLQPGQRGSSLLKNGEKEGGAKIEFEINDKKITVERTLKKGRTVSQDYCALTINGEKREYSVTELKDKVLELLEYPKEISKKQNLLYKFTVYTPQEEMKQIILEDPETRLNTLRHVFGIDKYKKILENTSILGSKLREEKRIKEGLIEGLEQDRASLASKEDELEAKHYNLVSVEKELFLKTEKRKKIRDEKAGISEKIEEKNRLQQEIEKTKIMVSNKQETLAGNAKLVEQLEIQIKELSETGYDEEKLKELEQQIEFGKKEKSELNEKNLDLISTIHSLNSKTEENNALREKLRHLEVCPTCLQNVEAVYRTNVLNKLDSEISQNARETEKLGEEKKKILEKIKEIDEYISSKEKNVEEIKILKIRMQGLEEKRVRISEIQKSDESLKKDAEILNQHLEVLKNSVFELNPFETLFEEKNKELEQALSEERTAEIKVAELRKEIEVFSRQIEELKQRIKSTEEIREKLVYITKLETWLSKNLAPLVSIIEKNTMIKLKMEFSKLFGKWFSMLVSDNFEVTLDDKFTPVIEHQDYELDYAYLSGGERTAIALAYRLSLNQVVNSLLSKIRTREIVILDEPTDGFSEQQLDKMRDVLRQLEVNQLIIVSHEQKIEGFVENVIRLKKENSLSKIVSENLI